MMARDRIDFVPRPGTIFYFDFDAFLSDASVMCKCRPVVIIRSDERFAWVVPLSTRPPAIPGEGVAVAFTAHGRRVSYAKIAMMQTVPVTGLQRQRTRSGGRCVPSLPQMDFLHVVQALANLLSALLPRKAA